MDMMTGKMPQEQGHTILHTRTIYDRWTKFLIATVRSPDGQAVEREIEDHGEAVCVLPYNAERKTAVLVRQMRAPVLFAAGAQEITEAVAGVVERGEGVDVCARRETREEAGLELVSLQHVFTAWTMPGISTERMHFYLAVYDGGARPEMHGGLAGENEHTIAVEFSLAELARLAEEGELVDVKTLLLLQTLRLRQPGLFVD
jgi:nudix-type nucleoside diphosphatase (YffH/AdpP family)